MQLENLLGAIELAETEDKITNEIFKQKLEDLKAYQKETELRKDKILATLFPEKIRKIITKTTEVSYPDSKKRICCQNKAIKIQTAEGIISIYDFDLKLCIEINESRMSFDIIPNKFTTILDYWSSETYRDSHMVSRNNQLNKQNEMMNTIENNIAAIYKEIAKRVEQNALQRRQANIDNLAKLNKPVVEKLKKQTVVITIRIEE